MRNTWTVRASWIGAAVGAFALSALGTSYTYSGMLHSIPVSGGAGCMDTDPQECSRFFAALSLFFTVPVGAAIGAAFGFLIHWTASQFVGRGTAGQDETALPPTCGPKA